MPATPRRIAVIVNPESANGRTAKVWPDLEAALRERVGDCSCFTCSHPGHATELTRAALEEGFTRIVSVGGDGTHNEVVNGFFKVDGKRVNPKASMAILPQGTASDFARTLGVETAEEGIDLITEGKVVIADVGRVTFHTDDGAETQRHFLNVAHFGLGGTVAKSVDEGTKALGGSFPYLLASLKSLLRFEKYSMRLQIDDETIEIDALNVIVANGRYFGGGVRVSDEARFDDGRFEVYVVGDMSRTEAIANLDLLYAGRMDEIEKVDHYRAKRLRAESDPPALINLDGEQPGLLPAQAVLVPAGIRLVTGWNRRPADAAE